ncbi:ribosomal RNA small subunit methyltransferase A [bacterium]|nr:ribosomal RNA small subunit methyltransferase A [bacterium]
MSRKRNYSTRKKLVKKTAFRPRKQWGQVFLRSPAVANQIIKAAEIKPQDIILEIGPGTGFLTEKLLSTGAQIIAVEKDKELVEYLLQKFPSPNLSLISADIRKLLRDNNSQLYNLLSNKCYKVVGNIPYYLTSYLIRLLLQLPQKPQLIILMVQKEVAQRITASPPQMNLLAVLTQLQAEVQLITFVSRKAFWPRPKVDSAIIKLIPIQNHLSSSFLRLVKAGFSHKRKYLITNISQQLSLPVQKLQQIFLQLKIPLQARAQELSLNQWKALNQTLLSQNML